MIPEHVLHREIWVPKPLNEVFHFFSQAENLQQLTPPWLHFQILTPLPIEMKVGAKIRYKIRLRGIPVSWLTEIERWNPPKEFVDVQIKGPYRTWRHLHQFQELNGGTTIVDHVEYSLPFGILGRIIHRLQVENDVKTIFDYHNAQIRSLFGG